MTRAVAYSLAGAVAALIFGCAQFSGVASLRGADVPVADQAPPEHKLYTGKKPGLQQTIARSFKEQPPLIPHAVDNFDEITVSDNQCMDCHSLEKHKEKNAPKIGDSHLAKAPAGAKATVTMDRYQCNSCHVPQVDAKPLVENTFVGNAAR
ncbi:MAG: nitrate reductase cytochrome c-type subunit; periplasmic nitrate reductase electron transfer subunit [Burkholderiales bacterium]|nr:MAG: nitrate reductase cytochrome c-type subunit; periplasmic nitrate reductase electron transfer subunit [Burkholderiales bacterium]